MKVLKDGTCLLASSPDIGGVRLMVEKWSFGNLILSDDLVLKELGSGKIPSDLRVIKKNGRYRFEMTGLTK